MGGLMSTLNSPKGRRYCVSNSKSALPRGANAARRSMMRCCYEIALLEGRRYLAGSIGFQAPALFDSGAPGPYSITASDFNHDNKADIAVTENDQVAILLG